MSDWPRSYPRGWVGDGGNPENLSVVYSGVGLGSIFFNNGTSVLFVGPSGITAEASTFTGQSYSMANGSGFSSTPPNPALGPNVAAYNAYPTYGATIALKCNSMYVTGVLDPVNAQDAATKNYVDESSLNLQYGDGSDGAAAFDGTTAVAGATTTGASPNKVYTLTRDVYYTTMTVSAGKTLNTGGFRIFVQGLLENDGTIHNDGGAAAGTTGGIAAPGGTLGGGAAGAAGVASGTTTVAGNAATAINAAYYSMGGVGGVGGNAGGIAGALSTPARVAGFRDSVSTGMFHWVPPAVAATTAPGTMILAAGGSGGGSGARTTSGTATATGAGGGGAGIVYIKAGSINNTGTISANGGVGSNATGGTTKSGGGGGGGGGAVVLDTPFYTNTGTVSANGGAIGTGLNAASAAIAGAAGVVITP